MKQNISNKHQYTEKMHYILPFVRFPHRYKEKTFYRIWNMRGIIVNERINSVVQVHLKRLHFIVSRLNWNAMSISRKNSLKFYFHNTCNRNGTFYIICYKKLFSRSESLKNELQPIFN